MLVEFRSEESKINWPFKMRRNARGALWSDFPKFTKKNVSKMSNQNEIRTYFTYLFNNTGKMYIGMFNIDKNNLYPQICL